MVKLSGQCCRVPGSDFNYYYYFADFARSLRVPSFLVAPASLRIYRNSTLRYASQWVVKSQTTFGPNQRRHLYQIKDEINFKVKTIVGTSLCGAMPARGLPNRRRHLVQTKYDIKFKERRLWKPASARCKPVSCQIKANISSKSNTTFQIDIMLLHQTVDGQYSEFFQKYFNTSEGS